MTDSPLDLDREPRLVSVAEWVKAASRQGDSVLPLAGLAGSAGIYAAVELTRALGRSLWYVVKDSERAHAAQADARFYLERNQNRRRAKSAPSEPSVLLYLCPDDAPWAQVHPDRRALMKRTGILSRVAGEGGPKLVIVDAAALKRRVPAPSTLSRHTQTVRVGEPLPLEAFAKTLSTRGYLRVPLVEDPGTFALRGGLLDLWSPANDEPERLELDGELLVRIRAFDPETQRTTRDCSQTLISPCSEMVLDETGIAQLRQRVAALADAIDYPSNQTKRLIDELLEGRPFVGSAAYGPAVGEWSSVLDYLPADAPILFEDPTEILVSLEEQQTELERSLTQIRALPHFPYQAWALEDDELRACLVRRPLHTLLRLAQFGQASDSALGLLEQTSTLPWTLAAQGHATLTSALAQARKANAAASALEPLLSALRDWKDSGYRVTLVARSTTQLDRLTQLITHRGAEADFELGTLARGVVLPGEGLVYLTEEEIFGERSHRHKKAERRVADGLSDLRSLMPGDYVVHSDHGIGRYLGLERRDFGQAQVELIAIEYLAGKLYLPIYRLDQISKYSGGEAAPKLDRLGGLSFAKTRAKVQRRVRQMADELLRLYSERLVAERPGLGPRDDDYAAFEATFPFEETQDQAATILDVLSDLESPKVMDRLVCGDVGFGKTEVALRATYRVAASGRQVALLCPTTVLAQQHANQFRSRLSDFGLEVRALSRFSRPAEVQDTLLGLKRGTVDVVVGTHRLLSKDVDFKHLGLLIVDEEQRFGVTHKERIKRLRGSVDVLTLSATPIPRTLQLAVGGLRDLSMISTPPVDRRSIRTLIAKTDDFVLVEAITRELERGGQVFYVHNRVSGLEERAARLAQLFPGVTLAVAHGQMGEDRLEKAMMRFVAGEAKILVCTAIIENGIDIPRANTLIVDRADLFGLSQLYQLRGRVGRSRERAYCYLLVPSLSELSADARSRLEAIERFSELGSGLKVAALDLELRGAGDFLGAEQSGFVASVGFELFCQMLRDAADELRGNPPRNDLEPELVFDVETLLPEEYIEDVGIRLSLYKQLSSVRAPAEVDEIAWAMEDRFGPAPAEARQLIQLMRDKPRLRKLSVLSCEANRDQVRLRIREDTPLDPVSVQGLVTDPTSLYRLQPDGTLVARRLADERLANGLELLGRVLDDLEALLQTRH